MIGRMRRWRLLTLLLLVATPGIAGTALDGVHPCPEATAASAPAPDAHADHGAGTHHNGPAQHADECHCLGACVGAAATVAFVSPLPTAALDAVPTTVPGPTPAVLPASRPLDRLPPSTAPPLG